MAGEIVRVLRQAGWLRDEPVRLGATRRLDQPDPLAGEPISHDLPWEGGPLGVGFDPDGLDGGPHTVVVRVRNETAHVLAVVARDFARAVWAAATQTEQATA